MELSFTWNTGGDLASDAATGGDSWSYAYDYRKRLAAISKNGTQQAVYAYDYLDQRVAKSVTGGASTDYVFDRDSHLIAEHDANTGNVLKEYVWVDDLLVAVIDSTSGTATTYYVSPGHLGEPEQLLDGSGTKAWDAFVNPWGWAQTFSTATASVDLRLPGQWTSAETNGLSQNHFRDYQPTLGRYIEADPLGVAAGQNVYGYVGGDPFDLSDPAGLQTMTPQALTHIVLAHGFQTRRTRPGNSVFSAEFSTPQQLTLIAAELCAQSGFKRQGKGFYEIIGHAVEVVDGIPVPYEVGWDRNGAPTSIVTIRVNSKTNQIETMFPGVPEPPVP